MTILKLINTLNANSNVVKVIIKLYRNGGICWNDEILTFMMNKYSNVYDIELFDCNE